MNQLVDRMVRAAKLEADLYEEVEADHTAMNQAMAVVLLSSLAAGLSVVSEKGVAAILVAVIAALISWLLWAFLTYIIGAKLLPEPQTETDYKQMLRVVGFSSAPGMIRVVGAIPGLQPIVALVAAIWMLVAMVVAVRQALDYQSTGRAVGVCLIGWVIQVAIMGGLYLMLTGGRVPA